MKNFKFVPAFIYDYLDTLRDERLKKALTVKDLSEATGVSSAVIVDYEYGKKPSPKNYNKLAVFFNWRLWE